MTKKNRKKIAIVGFAASSLHEAPFQDTTWEIWGLNELWRAIPKRPPKNPPPETFDPNTDIPERKDGRQAWDVWFECHPRWSWERRPGHTSWMQQQEPDRPIYMHQHYDDIPASVPIPVDDLIKAFGPYFTCGPAWMLAMAIHQKPDQIGVWGIDMLHDTEYAYQRACCDYYIGIARGHGIPVYVPESSSLGKSHGLYGFDTMGPRKRLYTPTRVKKRREQIMASKDGALKALYQMEGAIDAIRQFGVQDDIVKMMASCCEQNKMPLSEEQATLCKAQLEEYRVNLTKLIGEQREKAEQVLYTAEGSLQELGYWADVAKHMERLGV